MKRNYAIAVLLFACFPSWGADTPRIQIKLDASEAERVLAIVAEHHGGKPIADAEWQKLFATVPYQRLKKREASLHRDFTDDEFKQFVLSPELAARYDALAKTLAAWKTRDLATSANRVLQYLPEESVIHTAVFPMIKPKHNSFVFETMTDPAIFLYLDPDVSAEQFENTVAHEMHHIGLSSNGKAYEKLVAGLSPGPQKAAEWMGGFGEGWAVLAAAGGPYADPAQCSSAEVKANWQRAAGTFNADFADLNDFFTQVANGKLVGDAVQERAMTYFGHVQGPWYTVGYRMAVTIERRLGRPALIGCMKDPRRFLLLWNQVAGPDEPKWSAELLKTVEAK